MSNILSPNSNKKRSTIVVFTKESKALRYNFSFGNSLSKRLRNLKKVNESSLTKESISIEVLGEVSRVWHTHTVNTTPTTFFVARAKDQ